MSQLSFTIEPMHPSDWPAVRAIYLEGAATGNATFESSAPEWAAWDSAHRPDCRLVARSGDQVLGWVALTPYSSRSVYSGVANESIYIAESARGQGVGKALLQALIAESEACGIWTLQAGIFPENTASLALHEASGFRIVGRREKIGKRDGIWRDTMMLERRSQTVGID